VPSIFSVRTYPENYSISGLFTASASTQVRRLRSLISICSCVGATPASFVRKIPVFITVSRISTAIRKPNFVKTARLAVYLDVSAGRTATRVSMLNVSTALRGRGALSAKPTQPQPRTANVRNRFIIAWSKIPASPVMRPVRSAWVQASLTAQFVQQGGSASLARICCAMGFVLLGSVMEGTAIVSGLLGWYSEKSSSAER
jgi:hypothetical protein